MRLGTPSATTGQIRSRHGAWRDSRTSRATQCGMTTSATSDATFSNAIVDISRATSCGVTQVLVAPRGLARPKGLLLAILVGWG
jgi:invasion protein IalB